MLGDDLRIIIIGAACAAGKYSIRTIRAKFIAGAIAGDESNIFGKRRV